MLKRKNRLRKSKQFTLIYRKGIKIRGRFGMLIYFKTPNASPTQQTKIGFVTGKKIGNSVVRHRHARRLREIVREYLRENENALSGTDMTYISHQLPDSFDSLKAELIGQLDEAERRSRNS